MTQPSNNGKEQGLLERLQAMFPVDWEIVRHAGAEPVPYHMKRWWFCLGGTVFYLFIVQIVTGIALTFYYVPSPDQAYASVAAITGEIRFGWFIRSLHKWTSNFMIVAVVLHMLRVFITGAYRHPRQLNWCAGVLLLGTTFLFGFTGYSLVYEQLSYWGATVAMNIIEQSPLVGGWLAQLLRGGPEIGANTLTRFYILHIGALPVIAVFLLSLHIYLVRTHGVTEMHFEGEDVAEKERFFPFWPDHVTTELMVGVLLMYLLTVIALIFPAGMGPPADPAITPEHIKPEWYFFASFRLLKLTSLRLNVILTGAMGGIVFFWPFIEEWISRRWRIPDEVPVTIGVLAFLAFLVMTVWEAMLY